MSARSVVTALSMLMLAAFAVYVAISYGTLPETIACHFDLRGRPDGWGAKSSTVILLAAVAVALNALMHLLLPWLTRRFPESLVNIPWRKHWFATPERKAQAMQKLDLILSTSGLFVNLVLLLCWQIIYQQNVPTAALRLPHYSLFILTGLFLLYILLATVQFKPPREPLRQRPP